MKSYHDILNEQEDFEAEMIAENAAAVAAAVAASNAAATASLSSGGGGGETSVEGAIFAGLFFFTMAGGIIAAVSHSLGDWSFEGIKDYFKKIWLNYKLKPIIKKLSQDPEVVAAPKQPTRGKWQKLISSKLSDKEQKYVRKIFRKHFDEIKESMNEKAEGHVSRKIKFDIDIESTNHAIERLNRKDKKGNAAYEPIEFKEVNSVISKATEDIIDDLVMDEMDVNKDRFILQRESDGLTVVGVMQTGRDGSLKFVVITLYRGEEFRTGRDQKIIKVK